MSTDDEKIEKNKKRYISQIIDDYEKKEKVTEETRKGKEGFYRRDVDWTKLIDKLEEKKKVNTYMTDHQLTNDAREITKLGRKDISDKRIGVDGLGLNPLHKDVVKTENKLIKMYKKYYDAQIPLGDKDKDNLENGANIKSTHEGQQGRVKKQKIEQPTTTRQNKNSIHLRLDATMPNVKQEKLKKYDKKDIKTKISSDKQKRKTIPPPPKIPVALGYVFNPDTAYGNKNKETTKEIKYRVPKPKGIPAFLKLN